MQRVCCSPLAVLLIGWLALAPAAAADAPGEAALATLVDALTDALAPIAAAETPGAGATVALLSVRVAGEPAHAVARPWVSDSDALEQELARALAGRHRLLPAGIVSREARRDDLEAISGFADEPRRAARINRSLGTDAVIAARVRVLESSGFFSRSPVLHVEMQIWTGAEIASVRRFRTQADVADAAGRFTTWNPVLLASLGVGLLALRGRPAGSQVARAARLRAQGGRSASRGGVDLPIPLG